MADELQQRTIVNVLDLLSPIVGPLQEHVREWRLPEGVGTQLLELVESKPEAGQPLLDLLCGDGPFEEHRVWISDGMFLSSESYPGLEEVATANPSWWYVDIHYSESRSYYWSIQGRPQWDDNFRVVHFLHKMIALDNGISKTEVRFGMSVWPHYQVTYFPAALQDLVSLPRSRRTVHFNAWYSLPREIQRAVAFHCSPLVELDIGFWSGRGIDVLIEAMRANQCPRRLFVRSPQYREFALALEATACIEELTIDIEHGDEPLPSTNDTLGAVGRNRGIRDMVLKQDRAMTAGTIKEFWRSVMKSSTIQSVDASDIAGDWRAGFEHEGREAWEEVFRAFTDRERRECAELVADLIRTNPRITRLTYHPGAHDAHIMETRVIPIVQLNRFRPVVEVALDAPPEGGVAQDRSVSGLVGSPIVRDRPELLYYLLRAISGRLGESAAH